MKKSLFFIFIIIVFIFTGCSTGNTGNAAESDRIIVVSSIVPEAGFIEAVAGDLVDVVTIIPPGNSPANYQPTTREMQALSDADIYFVMQVPTEEANILPKISDFNNDIKIVNLRDNVSMQYPLRYAGDHNHDEHDEHDEHDKHDDEDNNTIDPHIWLSPKRVIVMVKTIAEELAMLDEANADVYMANAENYINDLKELDSKINDITNQMDNNAFMIYHGSYGYFADDYNLEMISIEADGKAATAASMQSVIDYAKENNIKSIFYQDEFDDTQAQTVAQEIDGTVKRAAPLAEDYIKSLTDFANALITDGE